MRIAGAIAGLLLTGAAAHGADAPFPPWESAARPTRTTCELVEEAAGKHALPVGFFTRLIWRESSFRAHVVSPRGAQGIAQFMPGTAALRRLADPFDPAAAIPASAHYLRDLRARFGNLGLAAAAYNAGERRVSEWLAGTGGLPQETRAYVLAITGHTADDWAAPADADKAPDQRDGADVTCAVLLADLGRPGAGAARVTVAVEEGPQAPWGAQVAGNFSLARAMASYEGLQRRHPALLGEVRPMVVRSVTRGRGAAPLFQVRVPAETRDTAAALCRKLKSAGGACIVFRN